MTAFDHRSYAVALARAIEAVRADPHGSDAVTGAVRVLLAFTERKSVTVRYYDGQLTIDDALMALTEPQFAGLVERLRAQGVSEIIVARGADAPEIVAMVRGLAADPGQGRLKDKLRDVASTKVMVILESQDLARKHDTDVAAAFAKAAADEAALVEWNKFLSTGSGDRRLSLGFSSSGLPAELATAPVPIPPPAPHVPPVPAAAPPPPPAPAPPPLPAAPGPVAAPASPPPPPLPQPPTVEVSSPIGIALANLMRDPYGAELLGRLTPVERRVQEAMAKDRLPDAIDALNTVIGLEAKAPSEQVRGTYGVVLRRVLSTETLTQIAPYALDTKRGSRAAAILRRGGEAALDLLVGLVAGSPSLAERVAYLQVVRGMPKAVDRAIALLSRAEWQVVRNIAEALGEARVEESVAYLVALLEHQEQRVRRAALVALARIGTGGAVEPLRRVLKESPPELKALVASSVQGAQARPLVSSLLAAAESETSPEVVREYCRALGRIGTPDAVHALTKIAEPGGRLLGRKPGAVRLAAVEGLRLAGGTPAQKALEALRADGDKGVREAASAALAAMAAPAPPGAAPNT